MILHSIPPIFNSQSEILILGSFPSVRSRETAFFYGHPQNRFWKVLAAVNHCPVPETVEEKTHLLLENHIALWDVIASCDIEGSSDSSIRHVVPNDLSPILSSANIRQIFTNGGKADELYRRYLFPVTGREAIRLPSTSPANAGCSLEKLIDAWQIIRQNRD